MKNFKEPSYPSRLKKILIAEDEEFTATELSKLLSEVGYQIVGVAKDGKEAINLALKANPDLILMDIRMPKLDGIEAAKQINNQSHPYIPIVIITAVKEDNQIEQLRESGILGYLMKPVFVEELVPAIETAYSRAQEFNHLRSQVINLQKELEDRKIIERAKDILMAQRKISGEEAMRIMRKESRNQRIRIKDFARAIVSSAGLFKNS